MKGTGNLTIKACSAQLTHDTETFGKMDPYCIIKIGDQEQRTKVHNNGGKFPQWNDTFSFRITFEDIVQFMVWDKDTISKNDLVGEGSAVISKFQVEQKQSDYVLLSYKGKSAGKLLIETQWFPDKKDLPVQQQQQQQQPQQQPGSVVIIGGGMGSLYQPGGYPQQPAAPYPYYPQQPAYSSQSIYNSQPGYQQPPPPMYGYQQPPPMGGYQQPPPMGGYQQPPPMGGYQQSPPMGGYQQPPPMGGYQQPPSMGGYQQPPPMGGYQQPPPMGQGQYPQQGYGQQPPYQQY